MWVEIIFFGWLIGNFGFVLPLSIFLFYTVHSVFPVLAAVEDLDAPIYQSLELGRVIDPDDEAASATAAAQTDKNGHRKPHAVSTSMRSMTRLLYSSRKCLSFLRGFGWLLVWNMLKSLVLAAATQLPLLAGLLAQIVLPLALAQIHVLWVHAVIARSTSKPFWRRFIPAKRILRVVGPPMLIFQTAEAVSQRILLSAYQRMEMKWEDFFPLGNMGKSFRFWLLLTALVFVFVLPSHLMLVRVEASLLPADEHAVVPLDVAIASAQREDAPINLVQAWRTMSRTSLVNIIFLYARMFLVTIFLVGVIGFVDFYVYLFLALQSWQF